MSAATSPLRPHPVLLARVLGACLLLAAGVLPAANLQVAPILVEFPPQEQSQALWLTNSGDQPLQAQVRVQRWTQEGGADQLASTRDLVASPALLEVAPGQRQLVRIVRLQSGPMAGEQAYRLLVDELPSAGDASGQESGLNFLLRYSIPVFVGTPAPAPVETGRRRPPPPTAPTTDLSMLSANWQEGQLQVENRGDRRARLSQLAWINSDGTRVELKPGLLGYVLAGQRMQWALPQTQQVRPGGHLVATFDTGHDEQALPLVAPVR